MTIIGKTYPENENIPCGGSFVSVPLTGNPEVKSGDRLDGIFTDAKLNIEGSPFKRCPICGNSYGPEQFLNKKKGFGLLPPHHENILSDFFQEKANYEEARDKVLIKKIKYIHDSLDQNDAEKFFQEMIKFGGKRYQLWLADEWIKKIISPDKVSGEASMKDCIKFLIAKEKALDSRWEAWKEYCNEKYNRTRAISEFENAAYKEAEKISTGRNKHEI